jgi:hypothetical protein
MNSRRKHGRKSNIIVICGIYLPLVKSSVVNLCSSRSSVISDNRKPVNVQMRMNMPYSFRAVASAFSALSTANNAAVSVGT